MVAGRTRRQELASSSRAAAEVGAHRLKAELPGLSGTGEADGGAGIGESGQRRSAHSHGSSNGRSPRCTSSGATPLWSVRRGLAGTPGLEAPAGLSGSRLWQSSSRSLEAVLKACISRAAAGAEAALAAIAAAAAVRRPEKLGQGETWDLWSLMKGLWHGEMQVSGSSYGDLHAK